MTNKIPSGDADATPSCPVCGRWVPPRSVVNQNYCSSGCRKQAWRRRHQTPIVPVLVPAKGRSRREATVYECGSCGTRAVGDQRCDDCGTWMCRVGPGGLCPHCDEPVAVSDLLDTDAVATPDTPASRETPRKPPSRSDRVGPGRSSGHNHQETTMRVGIYARVSTEAQEARGTIGSQLEVLRSKVAIGGDELVAEYVDDGLLRGRLDRPGFDPLRDAAETAPSKRSGACHPTAWPGPTPTRC